MDRAVRIIPFAVALAFTLWAYLVFDRTMSDSATAPTTAESVATDRSGGVDRSDRAVDRSGWGVGLPSTGDAIPALSGDPVAGSGGLPAADPDEAPGDLAFRPSFASRLYQVSEEADGIDEVLAREAGDDTPFGGVLIPQAGPASPAALGPGLYATSFDTVGCAYELRRADTKGDGDRVIGQDRLREGRVLVSLNGVEPDAFLPSTGCGRWSPWSPLALPLDSAWPGDYWIGDLAYGRWAVPDGCLLEEVVDFRGARLADVVWSGRGPLMLVIDEDTLGIRLRGCERPMVLVEAGIDPRPPGLRHRDG